VVDGVSLARGRDVHEGDGGALRVDVADGLIVVVVGAATTKELHTLHAAESKKRRRSFV